MRYTRVPDQIGKNKVNKLFTKKTSEIPRMGIKGIGNRKGAVQ